MIHYLYLWMFRYKGTALDITVIPDTAAAVKQHMPAKVRTITIIISVADSGHRDADPDPACHFEANPNSDPSFQIKAQNLEKVLKYAHI
jgi:hypothetical protein